MGQVVKRKKGRPFKADLARRTSEPSSAPETDVRRSLRPRNVMYNIDYDDYLEEEFVDEEEMRRRKKKLRLLMKVDQVSESRGRSGTRGGHARSDGSDEEDEDESERKPLKKRRVDGVADEYGEEDEEEGDVKVNSKAADSLPGTPSELPSDIPLPEKRKLELILDKLQKKDTYGVYAEPVDPEELPDYHDVIEHPMDFATTRKKLESGSYTTLEQFKSDVFLICSNAMQYNSSETIYHKQARSIQELAKKKFHKLRIEYERSEKEVKSEQKQRPNSSVKKQIQKPILIGSELSSGQTLALPSDLQNSCTPTQGNGCERPSNDDRLLENNSSRIDFNLEKAEELPSGKCLAKLGKKLSGLDEDRRATYNMGNEPVVGSESIFTTFEGEIKQLVAVGLHAEYSYARSLARFAATMGPVAWKIASRRIEQALPAACKFGQGWVGEYEPLPTPVLMVESCIQKESALARRFQGSAGFNETFKTSLSPRDHPVSRLNPERKSKPFSADPAKTRPSTPVNSTYDPPQNKHVELNSLQNSTHLMAQRQLSNSSEMTASRGTEKTPRSMSNPFKHPSSSGVVNGGLPNGNRISSPSANQMGRTATYFPCGQDMGLTDPVRLMRLLADKSQMQQRSLDQSPVDETPSAPCGRREDSKNAASVAARAWMSIGASKDQISAYNPAREMHPQPSGVRAEFPLANKQLERRPMILPQFDLSRFQVQAGWQRQVDAFPPDLNIGFQSPGSPAMQSPGVTVDSQQPDLALQL